MKRKWILNLLLTLIIASVVGIGLIIWRDMTRTADEWYVVAKEQMAEKNYQRGARSLIRAADGGFHRAQYELALLYDAGDKIPENKSEAIRYMQMALNADMPEAAYVTAVWTERGYYGEPDVEKAIELYERAARKGYENAMKSLVVLYGEGNGQFPDNLKRKVYWMNQLKEQMR